LFLKNGGIYFLGSTNNVTPEVIEHVYGLPVTMHVVQGHPVVVPTS
jgi:iron complex transport system ATP-binding protein